MAEMMNNYPIVYVIFDRKNGTIEEAYFSHDHAIATRNRYRASDPAWQGNVFPVKIQDFDLYAHFKF